MVGKELSREHFLPKLRAIWWRKNSQENSSFQNYGLYGGEGIVKRTFLSKTTGCMVEKNSKENIFF